MLTNSPLMPEILLSSLSTAALSAALTADEGIVGGAAVQQSGDVVTDADAQRQDKPDGKYADE